MTSASIAAPLGAYIEYVQERTGATRSFTIETIPQGGLWFFDDSDRLRIYLEWKSSAAPRVDDSQFWHWPR